MEGWRDGGMDAHHQPANQPVSQSASQPVT